MANSSSTWGWCLLEGIKNFRLAFFGRLTYVWSIGFPFLCCDDILWKNISSYEKQWIFHLKAFYLPNPTDLTFFIHLECTWIGKLFTIFYSFGNRKSNLFLLLISPWTQIKQLSSDDSLPNLPSVEIKLSNIFYSLNSTTEI